MKKFSFKKAAGVFLTSALALLSAAGWVSAACAPEQKMAYGKQVAEAVRAELGAEEQSKRLIKIYSCEMVDNVAQITFTYNYLGTEGAYAVEGAASVSDQGVKVATLDTPGRVWASIATNYEELN